MAIDCHPAEWVLRHREEEEEEEEDRSGTYVVTWHIPISEGQYERTMDLL